MEAMGLSVDPVVKLLERIFKVFKDFSPLIEKCLRLCAEHEVRDLGIDLSKHKKQMELLEDQLRRVNEHFSKKRNPSDASLPKRKVYNEEMRKVVDELCVEIENLVAAMYKDVNEKGKESWFSVVKKFVIDAIWRVGRVCIALVGAFCDWWYGRFDEASTSYKSYQGYNCASGYKSKMDLLLKDAEKLRLEVRGIKMDLRLDFVDLRVEEAPGD